MLHTISLRNATMYQLMDNIIMVTQNVDLLNSDKPAYELQLKHKVNTITLYLLSTFCWLSKCKQFGSRSCVLTKSTSVWLKRSNVVFCLIWFFKSQWTIFQICRDESSWVETWRSMCLAQGWSLNLQPLGLKSSIQPFSPLKCAFCLIWFFTSHQ